MSEHTNDSTGARRPHEDDHFTGRCPTCGQACVCSTALVVAVKKALDELALDDAQLATDTLTGALGGVDVHYPTK